MELRLTGCAVDLDRGLVRTDAGEDRGLTTLESALLRYLAARPGVDVGRDELAREVWRGAGAGRAVDFTVRRLRVKLGEPRRPLHVLTAHGHGYRFVPLAGPLVVAPPVEEVVVALATGELSLSRRVFVRDGQSHALSHLEARVLEELVRSLGKPVPRETLIARVWGRGRHDHTLDATIARLRGKLESDPTRPIALVTARREGPCLLGPDRRTEGHVPAVPSTFLDRAERDLAQAALAQPGLVTLLGTAGIGKTRLALQVATRWAADHRGAEAWFCDLTRVGGEDGFVARVATTLGIEATTDAERVGRLLAGRSPGTLVVLDNLEQLAGCSGVVDGWLRAAPNLRLLGTSRIPMGVAGERVVELGPLPRETGVTLFRARTEPGAPPVEDEVVGALVDRLDGLPLAIELAAALTDRMSASAVLERLGARLDLLVHRPAGATSQHSTLRGAIDWSWHLLDPDLQQVLAAASLFAGLFDADDASAVVGRDAADALGALVSRSLVVTDGGRYRLLASIREFARERLVLSGLVADRVERHADRILVRAEPLAADLDGHWGADANAQLAELRDDLLAALDATTREEVRGRLACIVGARGFSDQSDATHARLAAAMARGVGAHAAPLWLLLASCSRTLGRYDRAEAEIDHAGRGPVDAALAIRIGLTRIRLLLATLETRGAERLIAELRAALDRLPPSDARLRGRAELAVLASQQATYDANLETWAAALEEGRALVPETGDADLRSMLARTEARYLLYRGERGAALQVVDRAAALARETGRTLDLFNAVETRAVIEYQDGRFVALERTLSALEALSAESGVDRTGGAAAMRALAAVERLDIDAIPRLLPTPRTRAVRELCQASRAFVALWHGRPAEAAEALEELATHQNSALLAIAWACLGRIDDARGLLARLEAEMDPNVAGFARELELSRASVELEAARGTPSEGAARAAAAEALRRGKLVPCDDGHWRERPGDVQIVRLLLEQALVRA